MLKIKKIDFLISLYVVCITASELMGSKTFTLVNINHYTLNASVAIFTLPIIFSINDIITEVHGKERAKGVLFSGLIMICLLILFILLATALPPSQRFQQLEESYDTLFQLSFRVSVASIVAFVLSGIMDIIIFSNIRSKLGKSKLWLRNNLSNFVSQLADTSIFIILAFYTSSLSLAENSHFLISLIIPYWLIKCSMSIIETPLVYLGVRWLNSNKEN